MNRLFLYIVVALAGFEVSLEALAAQGAAIKEHQGALLQTEIHMTPALSTRINPGKVQPGSEVKLTAQVKNVGTIPSRPGRMHIRFALPKALGNNSKSVMFETETVNIPSIPPGTSLALNFQKSHLWPSIFDFVRNDWGLRNYEAVINIEGLEEVTGTRSIEFSAYYFEGENKTSPVRVISADYHK